MSLDKIGIANVALRMIGASRISSFEDGSVEAENVSDVYDMIRNEVLETHPWTFALLTAQLGTLATAPLNPGADGFTYAFSLPGDFLKGYKISIAGARFKFSMLKVGNEIQKVMCADSTTLQLQYLFRNDDPTTYSPKFCTALATRLAAAICFSLTQSTKKAALLKSEYDNQALPEAVSSDSQQGTPEAIQQDDWMVARIAGSGTFGPLTPGASTRGVIW